MYLKAKSQENACAAQCLLEERALFAPSVHCSYYSTYQLVRHILNRVYNMPYETQHYTTSSGGQVAGHKFVIDELCRRFDADTDMSPSAILHKKKSFVRLLKCRIKADYENNEISKEEAVMAHELSESLNNFLKAQYLNDQPDESNEKYSKLDG